MLRQVDAEEEEIKAQLHAGDEAEMEVLRQVDGKMCKLREEQNENFLELHPWVG